VAHALSERIEVVGLAVRHNYPRLLEQAAEFKVGCVAVEDAAAAEACRKQACGVRVLQGAAGVRDLAEAAQADIVLCAVVGMSGLAPVMAALQAGRDVALATKEVLVGAGRIVTEACTKHGARLLPVDSEHSAIFQCLEGRPSKSVKRILLTASGGPFWDRPEMDLDRVTVAQALKHPRWNMGKKVSVDSASMMNKGLEIMEAHWLFGVPLDCIDVVIHPESIVHSMVEFRDGSMLAQMSVPDMRFAIQYALTYPEKVEGGLPALDLARIGALHFTQADPKRFPCLDLARHAGVTGGTMPVVLNAANEIAVHRFLSGDLSFMGIWRSVAAVMAEHSPIMEPGLDDVIEADRWARQRASALRVP
jgi:1-deoxy-D-xylulose-5-phosphate reductoisomerase